MGQGNRGSSPSVHRLSIGFPFKMFGTEQSSPRLTFTIHLVCAVCQATLQIPWMPVHEKFCVVAGEKLSSHLCSCDVPSQCLPLTQPYPLRLPDYALNPAIGPLYFQTENPGSFPPPKRGLHALPISASFFPMELNHHLTCCDCAHFSLLSISSFKVVFFSSNSAVLSSVPGILPGINQALSIYCGMK